MDGGQALDSETVVPPGVAETSPLKPVSTELPPEKKFPGDEYEEYGCGFSATTPTSAESRIPSILTCPPAPKKRRLASSSKKSCRVLEFFNPAELETIFARRAC
ncbi:hypothetical protein OROGR_002139 [Orobanche gracilis]